MKEQGKLLQEKDNVGLKISVAAHGKILPVMSAFWWEEVKLIGKEASMTNCVCEYMCDWTI